MKDNRSRDSSDARLAVVLGSGLGGVSDGFATETVVAFEDIAGLGASGVEGQAGEIRRARVGEETCLFVCGRKHVYEDAGREIEHLVGYLARTGIERLLLTSAAGSLRGAHPPGRLVLVDDVIDLQFRAPLPAGDGRAGRPAQRRVLSLDSRMGASLRRCAREAAVPLARGVIACLPGPAYETRAEIHSLDRLGVDLVTMSGAPEIAIASGFGIRVAMIALITNWSTGISAKPLGHGEVLASGRTAGLALRPIIERFARAG